MCMYVYLNLVCGMLMYFNSWEYMKELMSTKFVIRPEHLRVAQIKKGMKNAKMERWHGSLKQRTKVMRGMHNSKTAQIQADGFAIFHNYIKGHTGKGMNG